MTRSPTSTLPARINDAVRLTDDEILGLASPSTEKSPPVAENSVKRAKSSRESRSGREKPAPFVKAAQNGQPEGTQRSNLSRADEGSKTTDGSDQAPAEAGESGPPEAGADPESFRSVFEAHPELRDAWHEAREFREIFPDIEQARALRNIFPTAADAERASAELAELDRIDALFFSNRPEAHAELATAVYRLNPEAFQSLARVMASLIPSATETPGQRNRESDVILSERSTQSARSEELPLKGVKESRRSDSPRGQSPREILRADSVGSQNDTIAEGNPPIEALRRRIPNPPPAPDSIRTRTPPRLKLFSRPSRRRWIACFPKALLRGRAIA